jgi:hypothetical protein
LSRAVAGAGGLGIPLYLYGKAAWFHAAFFIGGAVLPASYGMKKAGALVR